MAAPYPDGSAEYETLVARSVDMWVRLRRLAAYRGILADSALGRELEEVGKLVAELRADMKRARAARLKETT